MASGFLRVLLGGVRAGPAARPGMTGRHGCVGRLLIVAALAGMVLLQLRSVNRPDWNPYTQKSQRGLRGMGPEEDNLLGMAALPILKERHGGDYPDAVLQAKIDAIGMRLLQGVGEHPYPFEFHLLADEERVDAFTLPGGQILLTFGLYRLLADEQEIAAVLAHGVAHVLARHASLRMVPRLRQSERVDSPSLVWTDPSTPASRAVLDELLAIRFDQEEELEADALGVRLLIAAGFDPHALLRVVETLEKSVAGSPDFLMTHPSPEGRAQRISRWIQHYSPSKPS